MATQVAPGDCTVVVVVTVAGFQGQDSPHLVAGRLSPELPGQPACEHGCIAAFVVTFDMGACARRTCAPDGSAPLDASSRAQPA